MIITAYNVQQTKNTDVTSAFYGTLKACREQQN